MKKQWDILGLGCAAVDDTLYVQHFPAADTKTYVLQARRRLGGLTAAALMAAARLGGRCAYAATLGDNDLSHYAEAALQAAGVDTGHVVWHNDAQPVHSTVVVGQEDHTRTIFAYINGRTGADDHLPDADVIRASRTLFIDTYGMVGNLRAARIAHEAGVPVVADFERSDVPHFDEILPLVDHLIVSEHLALPLAEVYDPAQAAHRLLVAHHDAVVVTCGAKGCWVASEGDAAWHQPAYPVRVVDTTGCGDVFHGAYALGLAQGMPLDARVRFASATAALKATQIGLEGVPHQDEVAAFMAQAGAVN
jgi:ribokinase